MAYDPLRAELPRRPQAYPETYWLATAGAPPPDDGAMQGDQEVDVAIIGAGYTGLSCAYYLARDYGIHATVLEANGPGWGCSGRNGSFARPAIGRLGYGQWIKRWGVPRARAVFAEAHAALNTVRELIDSGDIACDRQPDGWLKVAHRADKVAGLVADQKLLRDVFGYETELLDSDALANGYFRGGEAPAALRFADAFAIHPLKFNYGLLRMARAAGARVHCQSPVMQWTREAGRHLLKTPGGIVRARQVVIATNGYSTERLHPSLNGRTIPVLSNVVVTRPMTATEQAESGLLTTDVITDTRAVLNYYRRLPDGRVLLGSRGPIHESEGTLRQDRLLDMVGRKFPALRGITADYCWGGWVALTMDQIPHITRTEDDPTVSYALGYNGSGVAAAPHAGRLLAGQIGGDRTILPAIAGPLPRVPLAAFRRIGQRAAFVWFRLKDGR